MTFTVAEMEMLCMFYSGTRAATIAKLKQAGAEMDAMMAKRRQAVESAVEKLERMTDDDPACILFDRA